MARYIDEILQPGEKVLYSTNAHWMFYLPAMAAWILALILVVLSRSTTMESVVLLCLASAAVVALAALYWTIKAWFHRLATETDVTNLRVVHKTGLVKRRTFEIALDKVESVDVNQSIARPAPQLRRRDHHGRRRGQGNHRHDCLAAGVPQCHHRAIGARSPPWPRSQIQLEISDASGATVDPAEIAKFSKLSETWWDPKGKMAPLHKINPLRLGYIRDAACRKFERNVKSLNCLSGLRVLDIGCGAGLLCEPFTRLGAQVIGVDASASNIAVAKLHADKGHLSIDYRCTTVEEMDVRERFDIVLAMEVVEHVVDVGLFLDRCASMLKPGGIMVVSTLNRNWKSFALAIVGAEYVLRWLPRGTHQWDKFVTPDELPVIWPQQARHHRPGRRGLQPVCRQVEPLVRHGRQLHGAWRRRSSRTLPSSLHSKGRHQISVLRNPVMRRCR